MKLRQLKTGDTFICLINDICYEVIRQTIEGVISREVGCEQEHVLDKNCPVEPIPMRELCLK